MKPNSLMKSIPIGLASLFGVVTASAGAWLRVTAQKLAWPERSYTYSPPRSETSMGILERAIQDIGIGLFAFGLVLLPLSFYFWLRFFENLGASENGNTT